MFQSRLKDKRCSRDWFPRDHWRSCNDRPHSLTPKTNRTDARPRKRRREQEAEKRGEQKRGEKDGKGGEGWEIAPLKTEMNLWWIPGSTKLLAAQRLMPD